MRSARSGDKKDLLNHIILIISRPYLQVWVWIEDLNILAINLFNIKQTFPEIRILSASIGTLPQVSVVVQGERGERHCRRIYYICTLRPTYEMPATLKARLP